MSYKGKGPNTRQINEQSLKKYSSKEEVTKKWITLNKKLNPNKTITDYNSLIIQAISVIDYVIKNTLKEENYKKDNFYLNLNKLIEKGFNISVEEFNKLNKIKWYRNIGAHHTETSLEEVIDYDTAKDAFLSLGTLLNRLNMLDREDIRPSNEKLCANVGETIGETCVLQELIGAGGSGRVFKGYHNRLDLVVAVKEIDHNIINYIDVANEKNMLLSLRHIGIPRVYDIIQDNQTYYLVMDYIQGQTLEDMIYSMGHLAVSAVLRIGIQLCEIVDYIHNFKGGIIFRDLKPSNVMIDKDNQIHLIDFGISETKQNRNTQGNIYSGTSCYASPEQLSGEKCDTRSDIYSLGATLYFITEGEKPQESIEQRFKRSTPERLINIIEKAMAYNKEDRYSSVEELKRDLEQFQSNPNVGESHPREDFDTKYKEIPIIKVDASYANEEKDTPKGVKIVPVIAGMIIAAVLGATIMYKIGHTKQASDSSNIKQTSSVNSNTQKNADNSKTEESTKKEVESPKASENKDKKAESKPTTATAFNGKATLTVSSYEVQGSDLVVTCMIENNYDKEFKFSPYDVYVMSDNGTKFSMNMQAVLSKGINQYKFVPGEKGEALFILQNYKDSKELTLHIANIFCFGDFNKEGFTVKLK